MREDFNWIVGLITVVCLIVSAVQSARKKAKEREGQTDVSEQPSKDDWFGEIKQAWQEAVSEFAPTDPESTSSDYYSLEDEYDSNARYNAETAPRRTSAPHNPVVTMSENSGQSELAFPTATGSSLSQEPQDEPILSSILGEEFDLRRAVIEAEILTPKYI